MENSNWTPYKVGFYRDENGVSPVLDFITQLKQEENKAYYEEVEGYITSYKESGTLGGRPCIRHDFGYTVWELPLSCGWSILAIPLIEQLVFVYVFEKKKKRTPKKHLFRALVYFERFLVSTGYISKEKEKEYKNNKKKMRKQNKL